MNLKTRKQKHYVLQSWYQFILKLILFGSEITTEKKYKLSHVVSIDILSTTMSNNLRDIRFISLMFLNKKIKRGDNS